MAVNRIVSVSLSALTHGFLNVLRCHFEQIHSAWGAAHVRSAERNPAKCHCERTRGSLPLMEEIAALHCVEFTLSVTMRSSSQCECTQSDET